MKAKTFFLSAIAALAFLASSSQAFAASRFVALVIGNGAYAHWTALPHPVGDADFIAARLQSLGFTVDEQTNLDNAHWGKAILDFARLARGADVAVVYYTGHGGAGPDKNWLIPVDAQTVADPDDLQFVGTDLKTVVDATAGASVRVVFVDACRDNDLTRSLQQQHPHGAVDIGMRGSAMETRDRLFQQLAAAAGHPSYDGSGAHSYYATALERALKSSISIPQLMEDVRGEVVSSANKDHLVQVPETFNPNSLADSDINILGVTLQQAQTGGRIGGTPEAGVQMAALSDDSFWSAINDPTVSTPAGYKLYLSKFPTGRHAPEARQKLASLSQAPSVTPVAADPQDKARAAIAAISDNEWKFADGQKLVARVIALSSTDAVKNLADSGDPKAEYLYGVAVYFGLGSHAADKKAAIGYWQNSAQAGFARGQTAVGLEYYRGEDLPKDFNAAIGLFTQASASDPYADYALSSLYLHQQGTPDQFAKSVSYMKRAADEGVASAQCYYGNWQYYGQHGVAVNKVEAVQRVQQALTQDDDCAQATMGYYLIAGTDVPKDVARGVALLKAAVAKNSAAAQYTLGNLYRAGMGVPKDPKEAVRLLTLAAASSVTEAQVLLGYIYQVGDGVPVDLAQAVAYYKSAVDVGNAYAQSNLGGMLEAGEGVPQDDKAALDLYQKAAAQNLPDAVYNVGRFYFLGKGGLPKDLTQAKLLYQQAAALGSETAKQALANWDATVAAQNGS